MTRINEEISKVIFISAIMGALASVLFQEILKQYDPLPYTTFYNQFINLVNLGFIFLVFVTLFLLVGSIIFKFLEDFIEFED